MTQDFDYFYKVDGDNVALRMDFKDSERISTGRCWHEVAEDIKLIEVADD